MRVCAAWGIATPCLVDRGLVALARLVHPVVQGIRLPGWPCRSGGAARRAAGENGQGQDQERTRDADRHALTRGSDNAGHVTAGASGTPAAGATFSATAASLRTLVQDILKDEAMPTIPIGRNDETARRTRLPLRQPPRHDRRRHRHRKVGEPDAAGRGLLEAGRALLPRRRQGRPGRPLPGGRRTLREAGRPPDERSASPTGEAAGQPGGVLGHLRQAGPSRARHGVGDGAHPALAHPGTQRHAGRRDGSGLPRRRRRRPVVARPGRPARACSASPRNTPRTSPRATA